jgi:hypothetical protein
MNMFVISPLRYPKTFLYVYHITETSFEILKIGTWDGTEKSQPGFASCLSQNHCQD